MVLRSYQDKANLDYKSFELSQITLLLNSYKITPSLRKRHKKPIYLSSASLNSNQAATEETTCPNNQWQSKWAEKNPKYFQLQNVPNMIQPIDNSSQTFDMQVFEDPRFKASPTIHPVFRQSQELYSFQIQLTNDFPETLHFYVASTFGCRLQEATLARFIRPHSQITLSFRLKQINLIMPQQLATMTERLTIFGSKSESAELFRHNNSYATNTQLIFKETELSDSFIQQLLRNQQSQSLAEAHQFKQQGDLLQALSKYEDAYQILRSSSDTINQMIACRLLLNDFEGAVRDIESALLWGLSIPFFLLKKVEVLMLWKDQNISQDQQMFKNLNEIFEFIRNNYPLYHISPADREYFDRLFEKFKKLQKVSKEKIDQRLNELYQRAVSRLPQHNPALKFYNSNQEFQQQLRQILLQKKEEPTITPQEVLDPIGYEIMKKPYILPCGSSCEEQTLRTYFSINGYRDPITRKPIQRDVFRNLNLQHYIKEHPQLKKWQKYEADYLHH